MKTLYKLLLSILIILALFISSIFVLKKTVLTSEKLKALAIPKIEEAIGRKVEVKKIDLSLFGSIVAEKLKVKEKGGKSDIFSADYISARIRLLPLLKKKVEVSRLKIKNGHAVYKIKGLPDLKLNFDAKLKLKDNFPASGNIRLSLKTNYKGKLYNLNGNFRLNKNSVELKANALLNEDTLKLKGKVTFSKLTGKGIKKGHLRLKQIIYKGIEVKNLSLDYCLNEQKLSITNLKGQIADGYIDGNLQVFLKNKKFLINLNAKGVKLERIRPIIEKAPITNCTIKNLKSTFSFKGTEDRTIKKTLTGKADFKLENVNLKNGKFSKALEAFIGISKIHFNSGIGTSTIERGKGILNAKFTSPEIKISTNNGRFTTYGKLNIPLTVTLSGKAAETVKKRLPIMKIAELQNGDIQLHLKVIGTTESPVIIPESKVVERKVKTIPQKIKGFIHKLFN